jgi:LuxR family maltose regulon positive regulatory protein
MGGYLRSELLNRVSRTEVWPLTRTSVLERLCGPFCDATLSTRGPDQMLDELDSRNLLGRAH